MTPVKRASGVKHRLPAYPYCGPREGGSGGSTRMDLLGDASDDSAGLFETMIQTVSAMAPTRNTHIIM